MSDEERCPECSGRRGLPRIVDQTSENPHECTHEFHKTAAVVEESSGSPVLEFPNRPEQEAPPHPPVEPAAPVPRPVCPYCLTEGAIAGNQARIGPFEICVVRCGNNECRKILGVFQALQLQMMPPPGMPPGMMN